MRTKSANEGEPLEPLSVDDDGVVVEPEFVAPEAAPVDAKTLARRLRRRVPGGATRTQ